MDHLLAAETVFQHSLVLCISLFIYLFQVRIEVSQGYVHTRPWTCNSSSLAFWIAEIIEAWATNPSKISPSDGLWISYTCQYLLSYRICKSSLFAMILTLTTWTWSNISKLVLFISYRHRNFDRFINKITSLGFNTCVVCLFYCFKIYEIEFTE